jgi:hypothetical protein
MKRSILKQSELIQSIGWDNGNMQVKYRDDGKVFNYFGVPESTYRSLVRSRNPGQEFLKLRDRFKYQEEK